MKVFLDSSQNKISDIRHLIIPPAYSSSFSEFEPIYIDSLREYTKQLKPTMSSTDIMPTRLFIKILEFKLRMLWSSENIQKKTSCFNGNVRKKFLEHILLDGLGHAFRV